VTNLFPKLKRTFNAAIALDWEQRRVVAYVSNGLGAGGKVLDVACGYGRNLKALLQQGINAVGVEVSPEIVKTAVANGLPCKTVKEFEGDAEIYDVLLMSHIVEHFPPRELLDFMDGYLDRLRVGGHLVIATPLMSNNFYDDFDHVRPYQPLGIVMAFGGGAAQVQYYARNRLALRDVWFRRGPWRINYCRARHVFGPATRVLQVIDLLSVLIFRLSFGILGRTDGWVGRFEKIA
jgi:SAM-dependent methyltransferase